MGMYKIGNIIANNINKNYKDNEFTAGVMVRELLALDKFAQLKYRFKDEEWDMILNELLDLYYDSTLAAQTIVWALRNLIDNNRAITFKFTEDGILLHHDYEPDDTISLRSAIYEEAAIMD
jgi:hypothetical protein